MAGLALFVSSCKDDDPVTPENSPPLQSLQVSPSVGNSPLSVRIQGSATDPDGAQDIASYRTVMKNNANSDSVVFTRNPLDTTFTLTCPPGLESVVYNFKSEIMDKKGARAEETASVIVNKKPNSAPTLAPLYVSTTSGVAPLRVNIKESATDPDSLGDIINYGVVIQYASGQKDTLKQNPTDTTMTFYNPISVSAYVEDKSGAIDLKGPVNVDVRRPSLTQTATLDSLVKILYNANFADLDSARLDVSKNGNPIISKTIKPTSGTNHAELFSYQTNSNITRGSYVFTTTWATPEGTDTSITANVVIPNYLPEANFSGLQTNMNEEDSMLLSLGPVLENADKNPEDNPTPLRNATSLDGKTNVVINDDRLLIGAIGDNSGQYRIGVEIGSENGGINTSILQGQIYDLPRIQGRLESNETHLGIQGTLRAYQIAGTDTLVLLTKTSDGSGNNLTDANGNFDFKINTRSSDLENILIMARQGTPGNYQGWVRTIQIPGRDTSGVLIRAVPYGIYNPNDFKQFFLQLNNFTNDNQPPGIRFDLNGEYLAGFPGFENFNGLEKIRILDHGYFVDSAHVFTLNQQNNMRNKILDPNDISGIIGNYVIDPNKIVFGNDSTFTDYIVRAQSPPDPNIGSWEIVPRPGIIVVTPKTDMIYTGFAEPIRSGRSLVSRGTIYLQPPAGSGTSVISHEFGHMFMGSGHPVSLPGKSVMSSPVPPNLITTGPADKKAGWIIYEPTFMLTLPDQVYPSLDYIKNILRGNFK
jgi:hypothetical protein